MSKLPTGYTELEYIQSSGAQYISSGVFGNYADNLSLKVVITITKVPSTTYYGADCLLQTAINTAGWGGTDRSSAKKAFGKKDTVITTFINKTEAVSVNGEQIDSKIWNEAANYRNVLIGIFKLGANGGGWYNLPSIYAKLYSCQITKNGTLMRDFVPCKNSAGAIGLYDLVDAKFYGNSGSGVFTAGPEILPPMSPTNLQTAMAVALRWAASEGAETYNVYRDGSKIGSTGATQFVDLTAGENETYTYTVTAENIGGESAGVSVTVYTKSGYFQYKPLIESANFP